MAQPTNDQFEFATIVPAAGGEFSADNSAATSQVAEPQHTAFGDGKSLWWRWTAPANGELVVDTQLSYVPVCSIYLGTWDALSLFADNPTGGWLWPNSIFRVPGIRKGQTYFIALDGHRGNAGPFNVRFSQFAAPANDDFVDRIQLEGLPVLSGEVFLWQAAREPGEPEHPGDSAGRTVWWTWTASFSGKISAQDNFGNYSAIAFYAGTQLANLVLVSGGAVRPGGAVPVDVVAGSTYQIAFDSFGGQAQLRIEMATVPTNDAFASRVLLTGTNVMVSADNTFASSEPGEPSHNSSSSGKSLWWSWTGPGDGELMVATVLNNEAIEATVYMGDSLPTLLRLGETTNRLNNPLYIPVQNSVIYHFAADGFNGAYGDFGLKARFAAKPANDDFVNRQPLRSWQLSFTAPVAGATRESGEPLLASVPTSGRSVWWTFVPPVAGSLTLASLWRPAALGIFTGTNLSALQLRAKGTNYLTLSVQAGLAYQMVGDPFELTDPWGLRVSEMTIEFAFAPLRPAMDVSSIHVRPNDLVAFNIAGQPNQWYRVDASEDLSSWAPRLTNMLTDYFFLFTDPIADNHPMRYYRVIPLP